MSFLFASKYFLRLSVASDIFQQAVDVILSKSLIFFFTVIATHWKVIQCFTLLQLILSATCYH